MSSLTGMDLAAGWGGHMAGGWMWLGGALVVVMVATAIIVLVFATRTSATAAVPEDDGRRGALDIVRERYARGEITAAEYDEVSARLR